MIKNRTLLRQTQLCFFEFDYSINIFHNDYEDKRIFLYDFAHILPTKF